MQPQKVSVTYVADDKKLPFEERAKNIVDGLSALFGTDENTPAGYKDGGMQLKLVMDI